MALVTCTSHAHEVRFFLNVSVFLGNSLCWLSEDLLWQWFFRFWTVLHEYRVDSLLITLTLAWSEHGLDSQAHYHSLRVAYLRLPFLHLQLVLWLRDSDPLTCELGNLLELSTLLLDAKGALEDESHHKAEKRTDKGKSAIEKEI
jgi:hypothetical protein